ncbi:MAG: EutN/CcmL family microcompartment protein [Verrucomicrobiota bacterium]|nr:EutN/CcmL family microcompartment protein [Verrucomicrobiota bacterium]
MLTCRVEGSITATITHPSLSGWRLVLCQPVDELDKKDGALLIAIDCLGAGMHQKVVVTSDGKGIRERVGNPLSPIRFMTVGVVDEVETSKS